MLGFITSSLHFTWIMKIIGKYFLSTVIIVLFSGCWSPPFLHERRVELAGLVVLMPDDYRRWYLLTPERGIPGFETPLDRYFGFERDGPRFQNPGVDVEYRPIAIGFDWEEEAVEEALEPHFIDNNYTFVSFRKEPLKLNGLVGIAYSWKRLTNNEDARLYGPIDVYQSGIVFLHPDDNRILIKISYEEKSSTDRGVPPSQIVKEDAEYITSHCIISHFRPDEFSEICPDELGASKFKIAGRLLDDRRTAQAIVVLKQVLAAKNICSNPKLMGDCYLFLGKCYRLRHEFDKAIKCIDLSEASYLSAGYPLGVSCALVEAAMIANVYDNRDLACQLLDQAMSRYDESMELDPSQMVPIYISGIRNFGEYIKLAQEEIGCDK